MKHHDLVEIEGMLIHETYPDSEDEGAFLIRTHDKKEVWIPKKVATKTHLKRSLYIFEMPQHVAEDKGLV